MGELTRVTVDFPTSHMIFPTLIGIILVILGLAILVTQRRDILASGTMWRETFAQMDKLRFFGTLGLTILYFSLMVPVGDFWPNTGLGFLLCSVPFLALTGLLFMQQRTLAKFIPVAIVAILGPVLVWWLFTEIFYLTLP
ncbi:tripartite tricarboxylate transporter TctB family protein [Devosia sp. J2-20]|uniref:tripartite tricarboxylate transporter TctB family protein n=1 Tax=Devosia sp. J2-20 TaxID=3026161 RepID=UPI00249B5F7A|nr:tripartite tricarboxylate transporter TctB family protein [Devosia sp. J2-20]WDQ98410.1 tripartite tricarboxylate transporter TctB family protein [Devosia sp. J2-20]